MKATYVLLTLSLLVASVTGSYTISKLVCPLNSCQKNIFLECVQTEFTEDFILSMAKFTTCAGLPHILKYFEMTCEFNFDDPRIRYVARCLKQYPEIKQLPGGEIFVRRCSNKATYYCE